MDRIKKNLELRKWESEHLPLCKNTIGFAVFEVIIHCVIRGVTPTVKEVVNSVPQFSRAGIYLQLKQLEAEGWIRYENGANDARNKHILTTPKLLRLLQQYANLIGAMR